MTDYTAEDLETINNYSGMDYEAVEAFMDGMISHINAETGATLAHFRDDGVNPAGSKLVSITDAQEPAFLAGAALMLRAWNEKGPNKSAAALSVTAVISDPHYRVWSRMFNQAVQRLRGRNFERV